MSINGLSFNDVVSNLAVSTDQGFIIYAIENNLEKLKTFNNLGGIGIVRMLGRSNIALLVGSEINPFKSRDIFVLWDSIKKESILEIDMKEQVKNVLINKTHLFAILDKKICLFDWRGRYIDSKITYSNDKGLCIMNTNADTIATLGTNKGEVAIWKYGMDNYKIIKAHVSNIDAITLNANGSYVATASEMGTLVRVYNVETENKEYEFRRGSQYAYVYDICFNHDTTLLACCSSNGTVHIWDLYNEPEATKNIQSKLATFKGYLPQYFSSEWSMKQVSLGNTAKAICEFDKNNDLHVATYDGNYFKVAGRTGEFVNMASGNLHINNK